jgi:MFS family permease
MMVNKALSAPFLRLYALTLLFFSANSILNVIVPLQSEAKGASNGEIGLIMGAYMFTCMFFRPWAGHLVHKHGPVIVLRFLLIVNGLALVLYSFTGLEGYFAARVMQGVCTAFFSMALQMGMIDALPEEQRSQGLSLYSMFTYMPTIAGPLIAIGLWEQSGMSGFAIAMFAIALGTGLFAFMVPMHAVKHQADTSGTYNGMRSELNRIASNRPLRICCFLILTASVVFGAVATFVPLYARQVAYGHAGIYLMIQAFIIVAARFAFSKRIPSDGQWHARFVSAVFLFGAVGGLLLSLSHDWGAIVFYAAAVCIGLAQALLYPTLVTYLTFVLPGASRNISIGLFIATADLGISLGGMVMGPIADRFSFSTMYAVSAALAAVAGCVAWYSRTMEDRRRQIDYLRDKERII